MNKEINNNLFEINEETITIKKNEYNTLKYNQERLYSIENFIHRANDFALIINAGGVIPKTSPDYLDGRIIIKIININNYEIQINQKKYTLTQKAYSVIKNKMINELNQLVNISLKEDYNYILKHGYEGGSASEIIIKFNALIIKLDGQVSGDIGKYCEALIDEIKDIIIEECKTQQENNILEIMKNIKDKPKTAIDEEFDKYDKLYKEKFGKRAYILEPHGTKEFAIECIKKCLEENKDILDNLYYPNEDKDLENGIFYSDTKNENENNTNNRFIWQKGDIKIAKTQCEFCKYNNIENKDVCVKYEKGKPIEVVKNEIKCPEFKDEARIEL